MKYFVISDLHGYWDEFNKSLQNCGYSKDNPDHTLVVLGDIFDRGKQSRQIYEFLKSVPRERIVLVRGNHDYLLMQLLKERTPGETSFFNGTALTACQMAYKSEWIAERNCEELKDLVWTSLCFNQSESYNTFKSKWRNVVKRAKKSDMYKWFTSSQWVNYWETEKFIGVHSFVPITSIEQNSPDRKLYQVYYGKTEAFTSDPEWRTASAEDWELATWGCPYVFMDAGLFPETLSKTLICGHYHCSAFHTHYNPLCKGSDDSIYYSEPIIAIDGTVARSGRANVLVIDENNECYDQNGVKLSN